jgi:hypothetical protein
MQLPILNIYFLLTTEKSTEPPNLLKIVIYYSLTLTVYKVCCSPNCMKLNISKTKVISFSMKANVLISDYKRCQTSIARTESIKDLGIFIHFHNHVNHIFSHCIKLLGLVSSITFTFASPECMHRLYNRLVRSKLEYMSFVWNSICQLMPTWWNESSRGLRPSVLIVSFLTSITAILLLRRRWNCTLFVWGGVASMHSFLFKFTLVLNAVLLVWK